METIIFMRERERKNTDTKESHGKLCSRNQTNKYLCVLCVRKKERKKAKVSEK